MHEEARRPITVKMKYLIRKINCRKKVDFSTRVFFLLSLAIIEPDTKRLSDSDRFGIDFPNLFLQ
jgi:hypothetical protein